MEVEPADRCPWIGVTPSLRGDLDPVAARAACPPSRGCVDIIGAVIQLRSLRKALSADPSGSVSLQQKHSALWGRVFTLLVVAGLVLGMLPGEDAAANPA